MLRKPSAGALPLMRSISLAKPLRECLAAASNADQHDAALRVVGLEDLMREARDDARDLVALEQNARFLHCGGHAVSPMAASAASTRASSFRYPSSFSRSFVTTLGRRLGDEACVAELAFTALDLAAQARRVFAVAFEQKRAAAPRPRFR